MTAAKHTPIDFWIVKYGDNNLEFFHKAQTAGIYHNDLEENGWLDVETIHFTTETARQRDLLLEASKGIVEFAKLAAKHWDEDRDSTVGKMLMAMAGQNHGYSLTIDKFYEALAACGEASVASATSGVKP